MDNPFGCGNSPVFTYPFFGEDQLINLIIPLGTPETVLESLEIVLCIDISLTDDFDCHCYLGVSDEKILKESRGRIEEKLNEMAENCDFSIRFHHSWSEYQSIMKKESSSCTLLRDIGRDGDGDGVVELINPKERSGFYNRIQILLPFFIEASTPIDSSDPKWSIYLSVTDNNVLVNGLLTTYSYFKFPEGLRVRISQVLVFPRYQGHGLGTKLYRSVTRHLRKSENDCVEICVEDPTDGFERLRGLVDWQEAGSAGIWGDNQGANQSQSGANPSLSYEKLINTMKLNEMHAERIINLNNCLLSPTIPSNNPKRFKSSAFNTENDPTTKLRQDIKRWLLKKYRKELPEGREERIGKLSELYESELIEFIEPLTELLKK